MPPLFYFKRLEKIHLSLSQNSAIEEYDYNFVRDIICDYPDNDGQNCCAFLSIKITSEVLFNTTAFFANVRASVENIINEFPSKINPYRDFKRYYAPDEAKQICNLADPNSQYDFDYDEIIKNHLITLTSPEGYSEILNCIKKLTFKTIGVASYVCQPYVFTFVVKNDLLYLFDTHAVPSSSGGNMKGMIIKTPKSKVNEMIQWLINRIENSGAKHPLQSFTLAQKLVRER